MNSMLVFCVGMMGAANPGALETQNHQPVQVAENYGIAAGGCYGQPAYRSPLAQNVPVGNSAGTANCVNGRCAPVSAANCPNGWCGPTGTTSYNTRPFASTNYNTRPFSPVSYQTGSANCPGGICPTGSGYNTRPGASYGPNYPQQAPGGYYPPTYDTRYNSVPSNRFQTPSYTQPRFNSYPATRPVDSNWPSSYRTMPVGSNYQSSDSPFFN